MWKNIVQPDRLQMVHMCIAYWKTQATDPHLEYVTLTVFHSNYGCTNMSQCYITCTLLVFLNTFFRSAFCSDEAYFGKMHNFHSWDYSPQVLDYQDFRLSDDRLKEFCSMEP
jgi:hypothetical protein